MRPMDQAALTAEQAHPELRTTKTTLYELIDAINAEVQPEEDQLVAEVVLHLFETGRIKLLGRRFKANSGCLFSGSVRIFLAFDKMFEAPVYEEKVHSRQSCSLR